MLRAGLVGPEQRLQGDDDYVPNFFGIGVAGSKDLQSSDRSEPEGLALCERKPGTLNSASSYVL